MSPSSAGVRVVGSGAPSPDDTDATDRPEPVELTPEDGRRGPAVLLVVLAVIALAGIAGTAVFAFKYRALRHHQDGQAQVTSVSRDFLLALTNFQASTIDADFNRVESYAVGNFQTQAVGFFSSDVRHRLAQVQAVSRGQIRYLYVESISGDTASTYADIDQTIANMNMKAPEQDELRIVLSLKKVAAGWRVSDVDVLQAPAVPTPTTTGP